MSQASDSLNLPTNHFNTIETLANREIARRIIAAMRDGDPQACWCTGERLIAIALDDAQLVGKIEVRRQRVPL